MNPFSTAPLFIALTSGMDQRTRNIQALLACATPLESWSFSCFLAARLS
jgi:small neutral amino acid transporter SnatA (MarC family)